ncbi:hypothetical protein ACFQ5J_05420 [Lacticaseibacillus baoqingensis]|uniref:DUF1642 domain-containing protein n=1 Tax=Lacticaseibacillus baoqingensis TaxID=2486013 RepID=A0ABW4E507_9LACO|nr:hypothetical protein [Lacticaseibacillus baoqingensis]
MTISKEEAVQELMIAADNCITESDLREHFEHIIFGLTVDHPKVKLPREVGEELEDYQDEDIDLLDYLHDVIDSKELRATRVWMLGDREQLIGILADAYRYGWEARKEALYNVKVPLVQAQGGLWFLINASDKLDATYIQDLAKKFSMEEINTWGLQDCEREEVIHYDD